MIEEPFKNVFKVDGKLATRNLVRGSRVYGEELIAAKGSEYRLWNPYRSKLAAAILKGLKHMEIKPGSKVLYLGAATGTTSSHVSDIVEEYGMVYCVELAERSMRDLLKVCEVRKNMLPIFQDARNVELYEEEVEGPDVIYQDISARDQADILIRNSRLIKRGCYAYVAVKSQSIDTGANPDKVFSEFLSQISGTFEIVETIDIAPYTMLHLFAVLRKK